MSLCLETGTRILSLHDDGEGWYMPAGVSWHPFVWMTPDMGSPTWVVSVSQTLDKWLEVNRWNVVEEKHSKSVMVSTFGAGQVITGFIFKNPLLLARMAI